MPYVNVQLLGPVTRAEKEELVQDITASLVNKLGKRPETINIVIQEIPAENWGYQGMLTDEWLARQADRTT